MLVLEQVRGFFARKTVCVRMRFADGSLAHDFLRFWIACCQAEAQYHQPHGSTLHFHAPYGESGWTAKRIAVERPGSAGVSPASSCRMDSSFSLRGLRVRKP